MAEAGGRRMGRPPRKAGERPTRERILEAAIELFAERGYGGSGVREIASRSGLSEGALYRHFPGKEAILEAILDFLEGQVASPLPFDLEEPDRAAAGDGREGGSIFRIMFESLAEAFATRPVLVRVSRILFSEAPRNERVRRYLAEAYEERADALTAAMLERCVVRGLLAPCDTSGLARVINAVRYQWCYQVSVLDREPPGKERLVAGLAGTIAFFEAWAAPKTGPGTGT